MYLFVLLVLLCWKCSPFVHLVVSFTPKGTSLVVNFKIYTKKCTCTYLKSFLKVNYYTCVSMYTIGCVLKLQKMYPWPYHHDNKEIYHSVLLFFLLQKTHFRKMTYKRSRIAVSQIICEGLDEKTALPSLIWNFNHIKHDTRYFSDMCIANDHK